MSFERDDPAGAVEVTHSPATVSSVLASVAAVLAVLTSGTSALALIVGVFGLVAVLGGLFVFDSERSLVVGVAIVFVGVVISGVVGGGNSLPLLVMGTFGAILAFDVGTNAFSVGDQLSDQTNTARGEAVHAAASVAVGVVIVGLAAGVYVLAVRGISMSALALLLFGALVLAWTIRA